MHLRVLDCAFNLLKLSIKHAKNFHIGNKGERRLFSFRSFMLLRQSGLRLLYLIPFGRREKDFTKLYPKSSPGFFFLFLFFRSMHVVAFSFNILLLNGWIIKKGNKGLYLSIHWIRMNVPSNEKKRKKKQSSLANLHL